MVDAKNILCLFSVSISVSNNYKHFTLQRIILNNNRKRENCTRYKPSYFDHTSNIYLRIYSTDRSSSS